MPFCAYAEGSAMMGATAVSNLFMLEYMPSAPGDYVKVYLYALLLCRCPELCSGVDAMAEALNLDAETVLSAFSYWEREGIAERLSDNPPTYSILPVQGALPARQEDDNVYTNRSYNKQLQALMPRTVLEGHELAMASDWLDVMHLAPETVLFMVKRDVDKRGGKLPTARTMFKHLNETALEWAGAGVTDLKSAEAYLARTGVYSQTAQAIVKRFGLRRAPSLDEIELVKKWIDEWKLDEGAVMAACAETVKGTNPSFGYLDSVLSSRVNETDEPFRRVKTLLEHLGVSARPTPEQIESLGRFLEMGFEFGAIEQAAIQCGENNQRRFEDVEKRLAKWKEAGAFTLEEVQEQRRQQKYYSGIVTELFELAGVEKRVTASDIRFAKVWTALIELDAVRFAAECARGSDNPVKYINRLVQIWSAQGITTQEKAREAHAAFEAAVRKGGKDKKPMDERVLTEEDFETGYYADIMNRKRAGE